MIPPDAASRLRLTVPDQPLPTQPVPPTQKLADALGDLVPGQRLMAQIQALLPNGTYRAVVAQREITLALPFSAKAGDSLELEVTENNGRIALAFVANRGDGKGAEALEQQSVATRLSSAGRLISDLLAGIGEGGKRAQPAPLNGNQPLVGKMPESAAELVPLLKEALVKSGMFYEAHQVRWAEGKLPTAVLLEQPQGRLSPVAQEMAGRPAGEAGANLPAKAAVGGEELSTVSGKPAAAGVQEGGAAGVRPGGSPVHAQLAPLVQQQLDALASHNFVWQGQVWPGQDIHWEISEDGQRGAGSEDDTARWQTRLALKLPNLGGIEATLRLRAGQALDLVLAADSEAARNRLALASGRLNEQLDAAGLTLASCRIDHVSAA